MPLVTVIALSYAGLLEGSVLTETVFAWPGLGLYITNSLFAADMNAVLGGTIVIGVAFIGLNLLSDLLYRLLDPRTRSEAVGHRAPHPTRPVRSGAWLLVTTEPPALARAGAARPPTVAWRAFRRNPPRHRRPRRSSSR